ncbi:MAG TPA: T9SS type A sorting domain-containing protein [Chitinophagales bacterium]|nr:T9SS type A sorting domain-containing protein [Chitinophagales bacterium]
MRRLDITKTIYCFTLSLVFLVFFNSAFGQTLASDRDDYQPGDSAILYGSGFSFGEPIIMQVLHTDWTGGIDSMEAHQPWSIVADNFGNFTTTWYVFPDGDQVGASLVATADGQSSFMHAEAFFTDAITPPQCIISGNQSGCAGGTLNFTGTTGIGITYLWTIINNNTGASFNGSSTIQNISVNIGNTPGTFGIQLRVTSGAASATCSKTVLVKPIPSCSIIPAAPVCPGTQNNYTGPSGLTFYSWSINGDGTLSGSTTGNNVSVNAASVCNGNYTLMLVAALNGCTSNCSQIISVIDNTSPSVSQPGNNYFISCGEAAVFTPPAASDNCSTASVVEVSDITTPGSCTGLYSRTKSWKAVDACFNESGIVSQTISVIDNVAPSIEDVVGDETISCPELPVFTAPTANDACDNNPEIVMVFDETIQGASAGEYSRTICWKAADCSGNESETVCQTINVINNTAPFIGTPVNACGTYTLPWGQTVTASNDYSHTYTSVNGCDSISTIHVAIHQGYNVTGTPVTACVSYTLPWGQTITASNDYSHTYSSVNGCDSTATIHVTINSGYNVTGTPVTACVSYSLPWGQAVTSSNDYSHTYSSVNGCDSTATIHVTINPSYNVTGASVSACVSYTLPWGQTVTSSNDYIHTYSSVKGCDSTATIHVNINPVPTASASGNSPVCAEGTVNLNSSGGTSYYWTGPNGFTSILQNPTISNVTTAANGSYIVTVTNSSGCSAMATISVIVNAKPTAAASSNPGCTGSALNLSSSGGVSYAWTGPNGFTSSLQNPTISNVTSTASGIYTVIVTNSSGCTSTAITTVTVNAKPTATVSGNSSVVGGTTLNLASNGGTAYWWSGPNGFSSSLQNPTVINVAAVMAGTYTVTASNSFGCTATAAIAVAVTCSGLKSYTITQGGWGANANGNNPGTYCNANFPGAFPNGLTLGCGSNWLYLTTSLAVQAFLPSGGTAAPLTQSYTNPGSSLSNTLAGQVTALALNVGFDNYDATFASATSMHLQDMYVKSGTFTGWTVLQVLNESKKKLGGCTSSYTAAQLNTACTSINQNYDGGTHDYGFLSCIPVRIGFEIPALEIAGLKLYPNPTNGVFVFQLNLGEAVTTTVDIQVSDMLGQSVYLNRTTAIDGILSEEVKLSNNLPGGTYLVRVISGDQIFTQQIIYQR